MASTAPRSFFARHEFLLLRLHSLTGLVPVGAYMVVHLLTNATVFESPGSFQRAVYQIHSLGDVLWIVEWTFIFLPILFHGILGLFIVGRARPNQDKYPYVNNIRYMLQRATGLLAFFFIAWHVFHMHGWIHADWWLENVATPYLGAQFHPYNAASSGGAAMQYSPVIVGLYAVGVLACVFHLANGLWTMGITWGLWITPTAQRRANWVCGAFGGALAAVSIVALYGMNTVDIEEAQAVEQKMYDAQVESGLIDEEKGEHKRTPAIEPGAEEEGVARAEAE